MCQLINQIKTLFETLSALATNACGLKPYVLRVDMCAHVPQPCFVVITHDITFIASICLNYLKDNCEPLLPHLFSENSASPSRDHLEANGKEPFDNSALV